MLVLVATEKTEILPFYSMDINSDKYAAITQ